MILYLTDHAVDRFAGRLRPDLSLGEARALLEEHLPSAVRLGQKTPQGHEYWAIEALGCALIVKPNGRYWQGTKRDRIVATLVPLGDVREGAEVSLGECEECGGLGFYLIDGARQTCVCAEPRG